MIARRKLGVRQTPVHTRLYVLGGSGLEVCIDTMSAMSYFAGDIYLFIDFREDRIFYHRALLIEIVDSNLP
jgi:hypothetical protein